MTETPSSGTSVPALEKGMDVLEFLAVQDRPIPLQEISAGLHKSRGELYRMVKWLVDRKYILRNEAEDTYLLGERLGVLFRRQPASENIIASALPLMEKISAEIGATSYLSLRAQLSSVVVATVQSPEMYTLSVNVGTHMPLIENPSCVVLLHNMEEDHLGRLESLASAEQRSLLQSERKALRNQGIVQRYGVAGAGYFETSFAGPCHNQLVSGITVAKIVSNRSEADRTATDISNLIRRTDNLVA